MTRFSIDHGRVAKRQKFYDSIVRNAYHTFYKKHKINLHVDVNFWHKEHISSRNAQRTIERIQLDYRTRHTVAKNVKGVIDHEEGHQLEFFVHEIAF